MIDETSAAGCGGPNEGLPAGPESPIDLDLPRLVADHAETLFRYAYRLTGSAADAEDLTQQTFLIAHEKLSQLREAASARSWLFAVLRNAYLKSQEKRSRLPIAAGSFDIESLPDEVVDNLLVDRELLQAALNELPDPFKLVVLCFYFEELSYREIAERLELPVGTVMSRLSRAKNLLRSRLVESECAASAAGLASAAIAIAAPPSPKGGG